MIRYALESFLVAWRHVPGYRKLTSRRTPLMTLFFAQWSLCSVLTIYRYYLCRTSLKKDDVGMAP